MAATYEKEMGWRYGLGIGPEAHPHLRDVSSPTYSHMSAITVSDINAILVEDVDPMVRELYISANKSPLARIAKEGRNAGEGTTEFNNSGPAYISARYGRGSKVRSQNENPTLPQGKTVREKMSFSPKIINGSFRISLKAIRGTKGKSHAIVDELQDNSVQMLERAQLQMARQAHNDGEGVLALVNDATPNTKTTVTIDTVRAQHIQMLLQANDDIIIGTQAEIEADTALDEVVSSVDSSTRITVATSTSGLADNNRIAFLDAWDDSAGEYTEKSGVLGLLVTGTATVQGLSTATRAWLTSNVDSTSEALTKRDILQNLMLAEPYTRGSEYAILLGNIYYYAIELFVGTPQPDPSKSELIFHGGAEGLFMHWIAGNKAPMVFDPLSHEGAVTGLDLSNIGYRTLYPLSLVEDGGNMVHRVSGSTVYEVACSEAGNYYVLDPKAHFRLANKTV